MTNTPVTKSAEAPATQVAQNGTAPSTAIAVPTPPPTPTPAPLLHMRTLSTQLPDVGKLDLILVTGMNDGKLKNTPSIGTLKLRMNRTPYDPRINYSSQPKNEKFWLDDTFNVYLDTAKSSPTLVSWIVPSIASRCMLGKTQNEPVHITYNPRVICTKFRYTHDFTGAGITETFPQGANGFPVQSRPIAVGGLTDPQDMNCNTQTESCDAITRFNTRITVAIQELQREPKLYQCIEQKTLYENEFNIVPGEEVEDIVVDLNQDLSSPKRNKPEFDIAMPASESQNWFITKKRLNFKYPY